MSYSIGQVPSLARTASGSNGTILLPANADTVSVLVNCTAVSGTGPSMTVSVQWSNDGANWANGDPADAFTALTAAGIVAKSFTVKATQMRIAWTITGTTPSFTFSADVRWADHAT